MNRLLLLFALLTGFSGIAAPDSLVNSGACIRKAKRLFDSSQYDLAIAQLNRIDPRDTNYIYSQAEKAKVLLDQEQFPAAADVCVQALREKSPYRASLIHSLALAYFGQGLEEKALAVLAEGQKEFPFDYLLLYREGIFRYKQKKFDEAEAAFFRTLERTTFHSGAHLYLSKIAMQRGNKVEGMLSMGMYLALNNRENSSLSLLESFVANHLEDEATIPPGNSVNPFLRLDAILRSKIAFEEEYQPRIPIDVGIVRQYQLLFDQLKEQSYTGNSPWIKFYIPIYEAILKADMQEAFVYHILSSAPIEKVKQWSTKNEKTLEKFFGVANQALNQFRTKRTLPAAWGYEGPVSIGYDDDGNLTSIGNKDPSNKRIGKWYYYDESGAKLAEGFYSDGKKIGEWKYYNSSGIPTSLENYSTGEITIYHPEGTISQHYFNKGDLTEGDFQLNYACGALRETRHYKAGLRHGSGKNYYPNGNLKIEFEFRNDTLNGRYIEWYDNGVQETNETLANGKRDGKYTWYYPNGKIHSTGNYSKGVAEGVWHFYHKNGRLREIITYLHDEPTGSWSIYDSQGGLEEKRTFEKHDTYDEETITYHDGQPYINTKLKKNKIVGFTYYGKNGAVVSNYYDSGGTFSGKGYYATGEVRSEFHFKKGVRDGHWKFYSRYGFLESEGDYENGELNGEYIDYAPSGKITSRAYYKDDKLNGPYTAYHSNGKVKSTGWFVDGDREQRWLNYYSDGTTETDMFYLNGTLRGYELDYAENGKLDSRFDYDSQGRVKMETSYREDGSQASTQEQKGTQLFVTRKSEAGVVMYSTEFSCGVRNGLTKTFLSNGKLLREQPFSNRVLSGTFTSYYHDGKPDGKGAYIDGEQEGPWQWQNINGTKYSEGRYLGGERDSLWTFYYFINNLVQSQTMYVDGKKHGEQKNFGLNGELIQIKKFEEGDLIAYKILDHGKWSDWKPFQPDETITSYYANGQVASIEPYHRGQLHGIRKIFYPTGQLFNIAPVEYGDFEGENITYHANGKPMVKGIYKNDEAIGAWEYYDSNGNLKLREHYLSNTLHGTIEYFANGKKTGEQLFYSGHPAN